MKVLCSEYDEWEYEDEDEWQHDLHRSCVICGNRTVGDSCDQCGLPLCPMHWETGVGFCDTCPTEDYYPSWVADEAFTTRYAEKISRLARSIRVLFSRRLGR